MHLALLLLAGGFTFLDAGAWIGWYVVGKIVIGVGVGVAGGWLLGRQAFRARTDTLRLAEHGEPLLALAALLAAYGAAELVGGYGFLAVFACAMTLRASERSHSYHREMHGVVERLERLMTLMILLVLGMAMTRGLLVAPGLARRGRRARTGARGATAGRVRRPVAAAARRAPRRRAGPRRTGWRWRSSVSAASGSLYYLAYATSHEHVPGESWLWSDGRLHVVVSVLLHGVTATPAMTRLDARRRETPTSAKPSDAAGPDRVTP